MICDKYPSCEHLGYPDCVDLARLVTDNPRMLTSDIKHEEFRKAFDALAYRRRGRRTWVPVNTVAKELRVSGKAVLAAALEWGIKHKRETSQWVIYIREIQ